MFYRNLFFLGEFYDDCNNRSNHPALCSIAHTCHIVIPPLLRCHPTLVALSFRTCCIVIPHLLHCHFALVAFSSPTLFNCHPALVAGSGVLNISNYKSFHFFSEPCNYPFFVFMHSTNKVVRYAYLRNTISFFS
jgi:hypothetical protein